MHDVTKRGLALAVATGGLLITGAAPAVSAVSHHPEHPEPAGKKSQPTGGSSHHAAIPISAPQVKHYAGRHKAPEQHTAASHHAAPHHAPAAHHGTQVAHHSAPAAHHAAPAAHHAAPAVRPASGSVTYAPAHIPAHAAPDEAHATATDLGGGGLLTGNAVEVPVDAPVNICGLLVTVLGGGDEAAGEHCVNGPDEAGGPSSSTNAVAANSPGALSDNVVQVPVSLPTNLCGDTVNVVAGHDSAEDIFCANEGGPSFSTAKAVAANSPGLVNGNVVQVPVDAPLNLCGITANVAAVYDTAAGTTCVNGGPGHEHEHGMSRAHTAGMPQESVGAGANAVTANSPGAVNGNVLQVPVEAPINACGDSVSVVGVFNSALDDHCVNDTAGGAAAKARATGNNGLATGNIAQLPIDIPTEICGVVAAVGGYHDTAEGNSCANTGAPTTTSSASTTGETGIVTGTVAQGSVNAPVQLCGDTIGAGLANSGTEDTTCTTGPANCPPPPPVCSCRPRRRRASRHPRRVPPAAPVFPPPPPVTPPHHHHHHEHRQHHHQEHEHVGRLPRTGTDVLDYAGLGAGALVLGAGAVMAGRRKSGSAS